MQQVSTNDNVDFRQKTLLFNGVPSIQVFTSPNTLHGALLKKENMLLFVIDGNVKIRLGKMQYSIQKKEMAFLAKDTLVEFTAEPGSSENGILEYMLITIPSDLMKEFTKMATLPVFPYIDNDRFEINTVNVILEKHIDSLHLYMGEIQSVEENLVKIKLLELLFYLSRFYSKILVLLLDIKENHRTDVTNAVEENMLRSLSLSQLAALSGRSLSSFRRDFLATYKMPPSQWIRLKRLEKAKELLKSTNMTITDICYTIGFENIAHFSRLFKSQFSHSPSAYRQSNYAA
jgi:AraC-like DNA-binding protein